MPGRFGVLIWLYPPELIGHLGGGGAVEQIQQAAERFSDGALLGDDYEGTTRPSGFIRNP